MNTFNENKLMKKLSNDAKQPSLNSSAGQVTS